MAHFLFWSPVPNFNKLLKSVKLFHVEQKVFHVELFLFHVELKRMQKCFTCNKVNKKASLTFFNTKKL